MLIQRIVAGCIYINRRSLYSDKLEFWVIIKFQVTSYKYALVSYSLGYDDTIRWVGVVFKKREVQKVFLMCICRIHK